MNHQYHHDFFGKKHLRHFFHSKERNTMKAVCEQATDRTEIACSMYYAKVFNRNSLSSITRKTDLAHTLS